MWLPGCSAIHGPFSWVRKSCLGPPSCRPFLFAAAYNEKSRQVGGRARDWAGAKGVNVNQCSHGEETWKLG